MESIPGVHVAFLAIRGQTERITVVEPVWEELCGSLPLSRVVHESLEANDELVTSLEIVVTDLQVLPEVRELAEKGRRSIAECLHHDHSRILQVMR